MFNLSLTTCSFIIKQSKSKKIDKIAHINHPISGTHEDENYSFLNAEALFSDFFAAHKKIIDNPEKQQTFSCEFGPSNCGTVEEFRYIYAKINSGVYGSASDILDANSEKVKFRKSSTDIDTRPFFLFVILPKDSENVTVHKGMLIFQNVGQFGVKTISTELMQSYFSQKYGLSIVCKTISPDLFIKKVIRQDNIKKLVMIKNIKSNDLSDNTFLGYGKEVRELADLRFSDSLWSIIKDKIRYVAGGRYNLFEFESQTYDNLKVVVDIGGRSRTINLHNLENLSIIEAIPDEIRMADGHPNKNMLLEHIKKVATEYMSEMVLQIS